jgi:hypothetical protein
MNLFKTYPFTFEDINYEIRVYYTDRLINVAVFRNNHPASGIRHLLHIPKNFKVMDLLEKNVLDDFIEVSKSDIVTKRWATLLS